MPTAPAVELDQLPVPPAAVPRPPVPPSYTLPKATDVSWQSVWQEDFVNDSAPQSLPKSQLPPVALVTPENLAEAARLGMLSVLLAVDVAAADMGKDVAAELRMADKGPSLAVLLQLADPIGRWVHSDAFRAPAVKSALVVRVYAREQVNRRVVKFDIATHLQKLAEYNEKVIEFQSRRDAYHADRARYDQKFVDYQQAMLAWSTATTARIEQARCRLEAESARVAADYARRWEEYRRKVEENGRAAVPRAALSQKPFEAPALPAARDADPAVVIDALATLSLEQMRDLLLATATESVAATSIPLGGSSWTSHRASRRPRSMQRSYSPPGRAGRRPACSAS